MPNKRRYIISLTQKQKLCFRKTKFIISYHTLWWMHRPFRIRLQSWLSVCIPTAPPARPLQIFFPENSTKPIKKKQLLQEITKWNIKHPYWKWIQRSQNTKKSKQKEREILTVDNFSSGFILGNNLRRGEIQLSLFSFIVRHIHQSYKYPRTCNSNNKNIYSAKAKAEIRNEKMKNENKNIPSNSKNGQKQRKGSKG